MKKNKFLSGLVAKLALAVVAIATVTFTSCEKEDFEIQVVSNPAEVNIVPDVIYIDLAEGTSTDVTSLATIDFSGATKEGNKGVIKGTEANPTIPATTVTVTASYNGKSGSKTIAVDEIKRGKITYNATIILISDVPQPEEPEQPVEYELVVEEDGTSTSESVVWGTPDAGHAGYSHDGHIWNENASEYFVNVKITYPIINKSVIKSWEIITEGADAKQLETIIQSYKKDETKKNEVLEYKASAYSIFAAYITTTSTVTKYKVYKAEKARAASILVAKFEVESISSTKAEVIEKAHPTHAGHYHAGHGHAGHGDGSNAGGGIIIAD